MPQQTAWFVDVSGDLDVDKLLAAFQAFFRENSEHWLGRFDYREAGPQLILQAYLQTAEGACVGSTAWAEALPTS